MKNKNNNKYLNYKVIASVGIAITLIGIVGISIGRVASSNTKSVGAILDSVSSVEEILNKSVGFIGDNVSKLIDFKKNADKVEKLEKENEKLKSEIIELKEDMDNTESLKDLKKSLNFIEESYKATSISTSIVSKNDGNWYSSFVIGAGAKDGVKKDSIVVNGKGLVGIVYETSQNYSKAISLLDSKSSVSFQLLKDPKSKGVITQEASIDKIKDYKSEGYLKGYMFDVDYDVIPGDVLVTSGMGIYPEGIPIGEVDKVINDKNTSLKYVVVKPYVDFKSLNEVLIIEPRVID